MSERWDALPRRVRWLAGGIAAVVLAVAVAWVLFVPAADWLARHDVASAKGPLLQTARDAARGRLLTLGAGLFAAAALLFTARNFTLSREGQVTDRYTKAIEQLGSDKLDVRIGGIYALERVARDSARDQPTVMEVVSAFVREHSHEQWPPSDPGGREQARSTRPDVQAAVTIVVRRDARRDIQRIDLHGANLTGANLLTVDLSAGANLTGADLRDANLTGAYLTYADLRGANLRGANLTGAFLARTNLTEAYLTGADLSHAVLFAAHLAGAGLDEADLTGTDLRGANLTGTRLRGAGLTGAHLTHANLTRADLRGANLTGADLRATGDLGADVHAGANLTQADLTGADLTRADLTGVDLTGTRLRGANLTGARWPRNAPVPAGWKLDTGSRRLAADTDSGPAEAN